MYSQLEEIEKEFDVICNLQTEKVGSSTRYTVKVEGDTTFYCQYDKTKSGNPEQSIINAIRQELCQTS